MHNTGEDLLVVWVFVATVFVLGAVAGWLLRGGCGL